MKYLAAMLVFFALFSTAEAHQNRTSGLHPMCNILWPCEVPTRQARREVMPHSKHTKLEGRRHNARAQPDLIGVAPERSEIGIVRAASGATAHVASRATGAFQCVVDRLQGQGYPVRFMGGFARSGHIRHSLHYAGLALDVNQIGRNVTHPAMPPNEISIAHSCGLVSGAQWGHADSGHFQLGGWVGPVRRYASAHRHRRYASR
jgi:hypothetical protein